MKTCRLIISGLLATSIANSLSCCSPAAVDGLAVTIRLDVDGPDTAMVLHFGGDLREAGSSIYPLATTVIPTNSEGKAFFNVWGTLSPGQDFLLSVSDANDVPLVDPNDPNLLFTYADFDALKGDPNALDPNDPNRILITRLVSW